MARGPELREDDAGFNSLAETYFVGQKSATGKWRFEREDGGIDLVGVEVDLSAGKTVGDTAKGRVGGRGRELPREKKRMEIGDSGCR